MSKAVGISTTTIKVAAGIDTLNKVEILVTSIVYDDGRVIEQFGTKADWIETKEPHEEVLVIGPCKDCGQPIYEDEDWEYDKKQEHLPENKRTIWHDKRIGCPARPGEED